MKLQRDCLVEQFIEHKNFIVVVNSIFKNFLDEYALA